MTETCEAEVAGHSAMILHVFEQKVVSTKFLNHNSWHGVYNLLSRKLLLSRGSNLLLLGQAI